ncbi:MAG: hypothetical protein II766_02040 [Paludibacteraceae bacterium]|nr:hypothetical protein [Paludibacteraceae bacterium]
MRAQLRAANKAYSSRQKGNPILSFVLNFIVPIFFLTKYQLFCDIVGFDGIVFPFRLGTAQNQVAANALVVALAFPVFFFVYAWIKYKQTDIIAILGIIGVLITGVVGLFELSSQWLAIKDGVIPLLLGILILMSLLSKRPLLEKMVCDEQIMDRPRVDAALLTLDRKDDFKHLFRVTTILFFLSFVVSAVTHYLLAVYILVDEMPTNEQIGELMYLKYPYCVVPFAICIIGTVLYFFHRLCRITGMELDEIFPSRDESHDPSAENETPSVTNGNGNDNTTQTLT